MGLPPPVTPSPSRQRRWKRKHLARARARARGISCLGGGAPERAFALQQAREGVDCKGVPTCSASNGAQNSSPSLVRERAIQPSPPANRVDAEAPCALCVSLATQSKGFLRGPIPQASKQASEQETDDVADVAILIQDRLGACRLICFVCCRAALPAVLVLLYCIRGCSWKRCPSTLCF